MGDISCGRVGIRLMTEEDAAQVAAIEADCFTVPWSKQSFIDELSVGSVIVADMDGEIVGYADMREICGECYINNVAVKEGFRKRGIGKALMYALEDQASREAEFITLEVRQSNFAAIGLYSKMGYTKVGVRKGFYEKPPEDAYLMTKILRKN